MCQPAPNCPRCGGTHTHTHLSLPIERHTQVYDSGSNVAAASLEFVWRLLLSVVFIWLFIAFYCSLAFLSIFSVSMIFFKLFHFYLGFSVVKISEINTDHFKMTQCWFPAVLILFISNVFSCMLFVLTHIGQSIAPTRPPVWFVKLKAAAAGSKPLVNHDCSHFHYHLSI